MKQSGRIWVVVLSLIPAPLITYAYAAARWPQLDSITAHTPWLMRRVVADRILSSTLRYSDLPRMQRAAHLDNTNHLAWERVCEIPQRQTTEQNFEACRHAIAIRDSAVAESMLGDLELEQGNPCAAVTRFQRATSLVRVSGQERYPLLESGIASVQCGNLETAKDAFTRVLGLDEVTLQRQSGEAAAPATTSPYKTNVTLDHCGLSLVYDRMNDAAKSKAECRLAYPGAIKTCKASINDAKQLHCEAAY